MIELNKLYPTDLMVGMKLIPSGSIDLLLTDPNYGMTGCEWDTPIDLPELWKEWYRVVKPNGAFIIMSKQPFTTDLVNSNRKDFRYEMIWFKDRATGFLNAGKMPMPNHENISVFYREQPTYNPQRYNGEKSHSMGRTKNTQSKTKVYGDFVRKENTDDSKLPKTVLYYPQPYPQIHNTQKPVDLFRYLIKTFSNEGEVVLDGYVGSGTTPIACEIEGRKWIGFENNPDIYRNAVKRINDHISQTDMFSGKIKEMQLS